MTSYYYSSKKSSKLELEFEAFLVDASPDALSRPGTASQLSTQPVRWAYLDKPLAFVVSNAEGIASFFEAKKLSAPTTAERNRWAAREETMYDTKTLLLAACMADLTKMIGEAFRALQSDRLCDHLKNAADVAELGETRTGKASSMVSRVRFLAFDLSEALGNWIAHLEAELDIFAKKVCQKPDLFDQAEIAQMTEHADDSRGELDAVLKKWNKSGAGYNGGTGATETGPSRKAHGKKFPPEFSSLHVLRSVLEGKFSQKCAKKTAVVCGLVRSKVTDFARVFSEAIHNRVVVAETPWETIADLFTVPALRRMTPPPGVSKFKQRFRDSWKEISTVARTSSAEIPSLETIFQRLSPEQRRSPATDCEQ